MTLGEAANGFNEDWLKPGAFVEVTVPNAGALLREVIRLRLELERRHEVNRSENEKNRETLLVATENLKAIDSRELASARDRAETWHAAFLEVARASDKSMDRASRLEELAASMCDVIENPRDFARPALKNLAKRMRRALAGNEQRDAALTGGVKPSMEGRESDSAPDSRRGDSRPSHPHMERAKEILASPMIDAAMKRLSDK